MAKKEERFSNKVSIRNRKAGFEYEFIDHYVAGLVLRGTEIKSLREGRASLQEAYCYIDQNEEVWIKGMTISAYDNAFHGNHEPGRTRKLLLSKVEIAKLINKMEKGLSIVPRHLFINEKGLAKLEIALGRGKKLFDKREDLKKKDAERELKRVKLA